jgi:NADPH-dependent 2,4-dienoyl-CoA reductase/sulfur reductase-like enzyme
MHLVVVGGSDAGVSAALRARELRPGVEVTVVVADAFPNFSICGLPYFLSGEVPDWHRLAHRTRTELEGAGLELLLDHTAMVLHPADHCAVVRRPDGSEHALVYDRLVVATGAAPVRPPIAGLDLPGVHVLHTMADSFRVAAHLADRQPRSVIVVGSGYIGLEMADALTRRGLRVTLIGRAPAVLPTVDPVLGELLVGELRRCGVEVLGGVAVEAIAHRAGQLVVTGHGGVERRADLVLVGAGVRPNAELAATAGAATGTAGALRVDRSMATTLPDVYAAGDCVETWHRLLGRLVYLPLGTTAHKQGRVAGENAVGGRRLFAGSLGTQVVKVFDLAVARTGLREAEARADGFDASTRDLETWDRTPYYPGAAALRLRLTGDRASGRLLGAQILGPRQAEIAKRIDVVASAISCGLGVGELSDLDLSYTPPVSSPWDPVQQAAQAWESMERSAA